MPKTASGNHQRKRSSITIPIASLGVLVGIDHLMSVGRAVTTFIGNAVATIAISRWEGELSRETLRKKLVTG